MDYRVELSERSPIRVLDRTIRGGLGRGNLGVVCAPAGVGKTAFLVDVALDELMRGHEVLHVALDQPLDRVRAYYDEIFRELLRSERAEHAAGIWDLMERGLRIQASVGRSLPLDALERAAGLFEDLSRVGPDVIVIDGFDWAAGSEADVRAIKSFGRKCEAEIWMSATVDPGPGTEPPWDFPAPLLRYQSLVDVLLELRGDRETVHVRLLKDRDSTTPRSVALDLDPTTLLLVRS